MWFLVYLNPEGNKRSGTQDPTGEKPIGYLFHEDEVTLGTMSSSICFNGFEATLAWTITFEAAITDPVGLN